MTYTPSFLSFLFFLSLILAAYWAYQIIRLQARGSLNQTFFAICMALGLWSLGFFMASTAQTLSVALFWRRFAALGWTSIFSFILIFFILLTGRAKSEKAIRSLWLLHIPALLTMTVFALSPSLAPAQYLLVKTSVGWTNLARHTPWDYLYYAYFIVYMGLSLHLVWRWKDSIKEEEKKIQARRILLAMLLVVPLGGFIDLFANTLLSQRLPQIAPLFILFPVGAMYYAASHHDVFACREKRPERIISLHQEDRIYRGLAIFFSLSGLLSFVFLYASQLEKGQVDLPFIVSRSISVLALGLILLSLEKIEKRRFRELLSMGLLLFSIPLLSLIFLEDAGLSLWAFPLLILLASLLFNRPKFLLAIGITSILTQRLVWILYPGQALFVDKYDYILRMIIFVIAGFFGLYVNRVYMAQKRENDYKVRFQRMISDVLFEFVTYNRKSTDEKNDYLLRKIGGFFEVDRTYLFMINHRDKTMTYSNEWCQPGIRSEKKAIQKMPIDRFPWWFEQLSKHSMVYIEDVGCMPENARAEQMQLEGQSVKSLLAAPIICEGKINGFIGMDSVLEKKTWTEENISLLNIMASILSSSLSPRMTQIEKEYRADYDPLTQLPNRFYFADQVNQTILKAKKSKEHLAIIFLDLDAFKLVNDQIGHKGGDKLLIKVGQALGAQLGEDHLLARFGGDEFLVLVDGFVEKGELEAILAKLMRAFLRPFKVSGQVFTMSASLGIASYPEDGSEADALLKSADYAMRQAKREGRGRYLVCDPSMREAMQKSQVLSNDLPLALEKKDFEIYYQPQIDLASGRIAGVEALLRWKHPSLGWIPPLLFIPLAEKNGLINRLGEWVFSQACQQKKDWKARGLDDLSLAVNLSGVQMVDPHIAKTLEGLMGENQINPRQMELEITESIAIEETQYLQNVLKDLKATGMTITIDDFGTQYSSLVRLKILPADKIKIDMQFVQGIEDSEKDRAIIAVIIKLAKSLGLKVLAEGVETKAQLDFLVDKECDLVQGYYYHRD